MAITRTPCLTALTRARRPSQGARLLAAACLSIPLSVTLSTAAFADPQSPHSAPAQSSSTSLTHRQDITPGASTGAPSQSSAVPSSTAAVSGGSAATVATATLTDPATVADTSSAAPTGSLLQPQPLSSADLNPGGANNGGSCGAYCSTRNGSPSLNGNGGGAATGKPCAGCVGKADNKNPPGQAPSGPVDHNAGYECDRNHGIGRSNPAHTGCVPPTVTCIPPALNVNGVCTTPPRDCKGVIGGTATAADCTTTPPTDCKGVVGGTATAADCTTTPPTDCKGVVGGTATAADCTTTPPTDCKGVVGGTATAADCVTTGGGGGGGGSGGGGGGSGGSGGGGFTGGGGGTVVPISTSGSGSGAGSALPFTGSNIKMLALDALMLLLIGCALATAGRRAPR